MRHNALRRGEPDQQPVPLHPLREHPQQPKSIVNGQGHELLIHGNQPGRPSQRPPSMAAHQNAERFFDHGLVQGGTALVARKEERPIRDRESQGNAECQPPTVARPEAERQKYAAYSVNARPIPQTLRVAPRLTPLATDAEALYFAHHAGRHKTSHRTPVAQQNEELAPALEIPQQTQLVIQISTAGNAEMPSCHVPGPRNAAFHPVGSTQLPAHDIPQKR